MTDHRTLEPAKRSWSDARKYSTSGLPGVALPGSADPHALSGSCGSTGQRSAALYRYGEDLHRVACRVWLCSHRRTRQGASTPITTTFGQINVFVINVFVANIDAPIDLYRLLELDVPDPLEWPAGSGAEHVESPISNRCYVAFDHHPQAPIWNSEFDAARGPGNLVVGLLVDKRQDVDRLYHRIKNDGHPVGQEPYDAFWGSCYAIVIDHDGNQVGTKTPIDHDITYEPTTIPPRSPDREW